MYVLTGQLWFGQAAAASVWSRELRNVNVVLWVVWWRTSVFCWLWLLHSSSEAAVRRHRSSFTMLLLHSSTATLLVKLCCKTDFYCWSVDAGQKVQALVLHDGGGVWRGRNMWRSGQTGICHSFPLKFSFLLPFLAHSKLPTAPPADRAAALPHLKDAWFPSVPSHSPPPSSDVIQ